MPTDYFCPFQNRKIKLKHLENCGNDILKTRFKQQQHQLWHQRYWIASTITNEWAEQGKRLKSISPCHIFFMWCLLQTEIRGENGKTKKFQKGLVWKVGVIGNGRNCSNWSLKNGISRRFVSFNSLSFTGSFFVIFQFVIFSFSKYRGRLSHFIQIWKRLQQLFSSRCEERWLYGQNRRKEIKQKHVNDIVTSSRRHEHQGPGTASYHSLHPLDLLISLLSLSIISLFPLILISVSLLSWSLWSCSRSNSRCSLSCIPLLIWTVALAIHCTNARRLLFVESKDSTFQGLMVPKEESAADESIATLFDPAIWRNETK